MDSGRGSVIALPLFGFIQALTVASIAFMFRSRRRFEPWFGFEAFISRRYLSAETLTRLLQEQSIPVFARPRRAGTVDVITSGNPHPWWEILVPEEHAERAGALIRDAQAQLDRDGVENAAAAEAEATAPEKV